VRQARGGRSIEPRSGDDDLKTQFLTHLVNERQLLIFDNFEVRVLTSWSRSFSLSTAPSDGPTTSIGVGSGVPPFLRIPSVLRLGVGKEPKTPASEIA
jgi:hypothetical protein